MKYIYPSCKTVDIIEDWFGRPLPDPYAWLKNAKDPEVLDFVARENAYTDSFFDAVELEKEIALLKAQALEDLPDRISPWRDGYVATVMRSGDYDVVTLDAGLNKTGSLPHIDYFDGKTLFQAIPCPKNDSVVAVLLMKPGAPRISIAVCDMDKKALLHEIDMVFGCVWSKADGCLYYGVTVADSDAQTSSVTYYRYDPAANTETVAYADTRYSIFGQEYASHDGNYILADFCSDYAHGNWVAMDCRSGKCSVLTDNAPEWYYIDTLDDTHYFVSMADSEYGDIIKVTNDGSIEKILAGTEKLILEGGFYAGGKLFALCKQDVSARLVDIASGSAVELPSNMASIGVSGNDGESVFMKFESFVDAPQILRFDGKTFEAVLRSSNKTHPDIIVEQHFAPSTGDGALIPYYLVYRKDAERNGKNRVLMYGYGGYNIAMPPEYTEMVSGMQVPDWVENGGIYVHCNLRGGNEYGPKWHEAGMGMNKRKCYEDFIGIAEDVIRQGWTEKGRIAISGCSNGGLLMSTLVTMRPDLWGCVIDSVPHTDMIHFAEDDRGPMYITEYGNPRESKEMFEYLLSYSPYYNVRETEYPATYIQTGELDNNVPPYHGKKFAAMMQSKNQSDKPILLRVLAEGSHDRGRGEVYWRTIAEMHIFIRKALKED